MTNAVPAAPPPPTVPARWWRPIGLGLIASTFWAIGFAGIAVERPGVGALVVAGGVIAAWACIGQTLLIRNRLWLGSALFGIGFLPALGLAHAYIWTTAAPAFVPLLLYLAAFPALSVYLVARLRRTWPQIPVAAAFPLVWVGLEVARGEWLLGGYPWYLLGHSLTRSGGLSWAAPLVGAYGCSLLLAVACGAAVDIASSRGRTTTRVAAAVLVPVIGYLLLTIPAATPVASRSFRVSILQTNLPQDNKIGWALNDRVDAHKRWLAMSQQAADQIPSPQLIVWPETMFAGFSLNPEAIDAQRRAGLTYGSGTGAVPATWFADSLLNLQGRMKMPFLVGSIASDNLRYEQGEAGTVRTLLDSRTNSAVLVFNGQAEQQRYDKVDLMAFGEYIPLAWRWPAVQQWLTGLGAHGMSFDLAFGKGRPLFNIAGVRTGTPICFEVCHQSSCRAFTTEGGKRRADMLVNLTNDGWFYGSDFNRRMHLLQARWRCAELRTPMVRAANTGVSCIVSPTGEVRTRTLDGGAPLARQEGVVSGDVELVDPQAPATLFATAGHLVVPGVALGGASVVLLAFWPRPRVSGRTGEGRAA